MVPSAAVARRMAVPAESARNTPFESMLATAGVSELQVIVVGIATLDGLRSVANNWSSNPAGSAGSDASRPVKDSVFAGGVEFGLHSPNVDGPEVQTFAQSRCNDVPIGAFVCRGPMSRDVKPAAGPEVAVITPS